jgi:hypothetical protein
MPDPDARPTCNWPRCRSPKTGKCFAWCKCRCHAWMYQQGSKS